MQKPEKWAELEASVGSHTSSTAGKKSATYIDMWTDFNENPAKFDITNKEVYKSIVDSYEDHKQLEYTAHLPLQVMLQAASDAVKLSERSKNITDTASFKLWLSWETMGEDHKIRGRSTIRFAPSMARRQQQERERAEAEKEKSGGRVEQEAAEERQSAEKRPSGEERQSVEEH